MFTPEEIISGVSSRKKKESKKLYNLLRKEHWNYNLKYLGGLPNYKKGILHTTNLDLFLTLYGLHFFDIKSSYTEYIIPMNLVMGIKLTSEEKKGFKKQYQNSSWIGGMTNSNPDNIQAAAIGIGVIDSLFSGVKNALIISFKLSSDDDLISEAGFQSRKAIKIRDEMIAIRQQSIDEGFFKKEQIITNNSDMLERLERLAKLKEGGHLTIEEYEKEKNKLLSE